MSKNNFNKNQEKRAPETETATKKEDESVESTVEETTETETEDTSNTADSDVEETQEETTEEESQPDEQKTDDRQTLIDELGVKPVGVDIMTGQPILPNTPMLRRMKELQDSQNNGVAVTNKTLTDVVKEKYGEQTAKHPTVTYAVSILSEYVERMSPNNLVTEEEGAAYQLKLARLYDAVLNAEPELSMICLEIIVATVTEHISGVFSERYAQRFINVVRLNPEQSYRFQMLTTLFMELGRRAKQKSPAPIGESVNIPRLMDFIPDRNAKANLAEFLS